MHAHAVALVPHPVALDQVLAAAGPGEGQRGQDQGKGQALGQAAEVGDRVGQRAPGLGGDRGGDGDHDEEQDDPDLEELDPLDQGVDHRGHGQGDGDRGQPEDGQQLHVAAAEDEGDHRGRAGDPPRPGVGQEGQHGEEQPPVPPVAAEPGQGGLAGGQGVALDLHVDEELGHHPDDRGPQEHEPDLGGDVGPEDELARGQPDPGRDHAGAEDLAQRERLGHVPVADRGQVPGREGRRCRAGLGRLSVSAVDVPGHGAHHPSSAVLASSGSYPASARPIPTLPRWPWPPAGPAPAGPRRSGGRAP